MPPASFGSQRGASPSGIETDVTCRVSIAESMTVENSTDMTGFICPHHIDPRLASARVITACNVRGAQAPAVTKARGAGNIAIMFDHTDPRQRKTMTSRFLP